MSTTISLSSSMRQEFLNAGNKVRAYVFFRGRSILFKEQGEVLLLRFANDLEELAKVEQLPKTRRQEDVPLSCT